MGRRKGRVPEQTGQGSEARSRRVPNQQCGAQHGQAARQIESEPAGPASGKARGRGQPRVEGRFGRNFADGVALHDPVPVANDIEHVRRRPLLVIVRQVRGRTEPHEEQGDPHRPKQRPRASVRRARRGQARGGGERHASSRPSLGRRTCPKPIPVTSLTCFFQALGWAVPGTRLASPARRSNRAQGAVSQFQIVGGGTRHCASTAAIESGHYRDCQKRWLKLARIE